MSQACVFGEFENLVGVYETVAKPAMCSKQAVLILTPGMLHSAGPFRLHTAIAEELAQAGIPSLRFDLSGIGESLAIGAAGSSLERAASEIRQAIDYLQREQGIQRVVCFGLCSGADDAIFAALDEPRIAGVYALDGCGFRTWKYHWHRIWVRYVPKLMSLSKWLEKLKKTIGMIEQTPPSLQLGTDMREFPQHDVAESQLIRLAQRGVQMHFHYTGGVDEYYNYPAQFQDMFPGLQAECASGVTWSYQPESDHVGFLCEQRTEIVNEVKNRIVSMCGSLPKNEKSATPLDASQTIAVPNVPDKSVPVCPAVFPAMETDGVWGVGSQQ